MVLSYFSFFYHKKIVIEPNHHLSWFNFSSTL